MSFAIAGAALVDDLLRRLDAFEAVELDQRVQRQRDLEAVVALARRGEARLEGLARAERVGLQQHRVAAHPLAVAA